jgi:hypothetical protein
MTGSHMSEADLARDLHAVLTQVPQGVGLSWSGTRGLLPSSRVLIRVAEEREKARSFTIPLDPDFDARVEEIVRSRKPWPPGSWERAQGIAKGPTRSAEV